MPFPLALFDHAADEAAAFLAQENFLREKKSLPAEEGNLVASFRKNDQVIRLEWNEKQSWLHITTRHGDGDSASAEEIFFRLLTGSDSALQTAALQDALTTLRYIASTHTHHDDDDHHCGCAHH